MTFRVLAVASFFVLSAVVAESGFVAPSTDDAFFAETFESVTQVDELTWVKSSVEKYASQPIEIQKSELSLGVFKDDQSLALVESAKHYAISRKLDQPFLIDGSNGRKQMVIQYEVRLQNGLECGGAYIKLLSHSEVKDLTKVDEKSPYIIMFGPDRCGDNDKVHFIFRHKNPVSGKWEEKHMKNAPTIQTDSLPHLYTLVIQDDNTFELKIDMMTKVTGSLLTNFEPAVNPPEQIEDPKDKKPSDWVDEEMIADPKATKPEDWDESAPEEIEDKDAVKPSGWLDDEQDNIPDPDAEKPEDWNDEEDGEYEAPLVPNPKCSEAPGCGEWVRPTKPNPAFKGKWSAPMIKNPAYKGEWKPKMIKNPDYFVDKHPARMPAIGAVTIEVWTMNGGINFDNFWLGHDATAAAKFAKETWQKEFDLEKVEEDAKKKEEKSKLREMELSGSLEDRFKVYWTDFLRFANSYPLAAMFVFASLLAFLISACMYCCGSSHSEVEEKDVGKKKKNDDPADKKGDAKKKEEIEEDENEVEDEDEDEDEDEEEDDEEEKSNLRQRKRAPKAD